MAMTVNDLLSDPRLELRPVWAGDLERQIRWLHATEMPDPSGYLRGSEVVVTAGMWLDGPGSIHRFVDALAAVGAAALGFGVNPRVPELPPALARRCRRAGLTLFEIPNHVPFIAVVEAFVERYVEERERPLTDAIGRNAEFVRAAGSGGGVPALLAVLHRHCPVGAMVIDRRRAAVLAAAGPPPATDGAAEASEFPIIGGHTVAADLIVARPRERLSTEELATIAQALPFLAIELHRLAAVRESERRFAAELFDLIAAGESQLTAARLRIETFGLDPDRALIGVVCATSSADAALDRLERALEDRRLAGVFAIKGVEIRGIVQPLGEPDPAELGRGLHAALTGGDAVGVGGIAAGVDGLRTSLIEAAHACNAARRRRGAGYATHDEAGSHTLLLALQDEQVLDKFRDSLLRPLIEHDARRHTQLVETLERFLASNGQYQPTADALRVHVNTLRLRLARIEHLTGRRLSSMGDRVDLFIALASRVGADG